jgi:eukaryotic-like serine/threonine-protein kinase
VLGGKPAAVIVEGAPGVGKSALVRRFLGLIEGEAAVLPGRCDEREWLPYKAVDAIVDGLSDLLARLSPEERAEVSPPDTALLGRIFPVLHTVWPSPDEGPVSRVRPRTDDGAEAELRARAFAALRELLRRLAKLRPLVLAVDDLHWADADSMALLAEVMRPPGAPAMLFLATTRADAEGPPPAPPPWPARRLVLDRLPA